MSQDNVLRVGVYNNFNFTKAELDAVARVIEGSDVKPFVNSNSFVTISAEYPSIITVNPYLTDFVEPVGDLSNVKACRIKWVHGAINKVWEAQMEALQWCQDHDIPALLTFMRFRKKASFEQYVSAANRVEKYSFRGGYYRANHDANVKLVDHMRACVAKPELIYTCDLAEKGCPECGNCARLTYGNPDANIESLSLSCSGDAGRCLFNCPDCWAKNVIMRNGVAYDKVTKNSKQRGKK